LNNVLRNEEIGGILLLDKPRGKTSFSLVALLRRLSGIKKIGHAGTLDPFATGIMVMLIGKAYTRLSDQFIHHDKEYITKLHLGIATDSYDCDGRVTSTSQKVPLLSEIQEALKNFQGAVLQTPPMFSAKKINGKKLYKLARIGIEVERQPVPITLQTELISYAYPFLELKIACSKGTYIRSIAQDLGQLLGSGAHLIELVRTKSGPFHLKDCVDVSSLNESNFKIALRK
jgi:tRNA pseudouridine55 synthase